MCCSCNHDCKPSLKMLLSFCNLFYMKICYIRKRLFELSIPSRFQPPAKQVCKNIILLCGCTIVLPVSIKQSNKTRLQYICHDDINRCIHRSAPHQKHLFSFLPPRMAQHLAMRTDSWWLAPPTGLKRLTKPPVEGLSSDFTYLCQTHRLESKSSSTSSPNRETIHWPKMRSLLCVKRQRVRQTDI